MSHSKRHPPVSGLEDRLRLALSCPLCHCCGEKRHDDGIPCVSCETTRREALEEARSVIEGHIKKLRTFKLARNTYVPAIVRELEIVSEKLKTLEGKARGQG